MRDYGSPIPLNKKKKNKLFVFSISVAAVLLLLGVWTGVYLIHQRHMQQNLEKKQAKQQDSIKQAHVKKAPVSKPSVAVKSLAAPQPQFDFYQLLPEIQVSVAGNDKSTEPVNVINYRYLLQVASTKNLSAARDLQERLLRMRVESYLQSRSVKAGRLYRVMVGPFIDVVEAQAIQNKLRLQNIDGLMLRQVGAKCSAFAR